MAPSISENHKKRKRGRPVTTGTTPLTGIRFPPSMMRDIEKWARSQDDKPARAEAIRRLVALGLGHAAPTGRLSQQAREKASTMASAVVDRLTDDSASVEEQQQRKRRLIKGPLEFRERDQARRGVKNKAKGL